jgi:hypothetical protein
VSEFRSEISSRIDQVKGDLARGAADGDDYLVEVSLGELESLARIAAEHDLPVDGLDETLAPYGLRTPGAGLPIVQPFVQAAVQPSGEPVARPAGPA